MANQWLRLWHDMPIDPKWIVIAEKSEQPISLVISVYIHMLVNASLSPLRGHLHHWCDEDVAAALRTQPNAIERIRTQMNGKVLTGDKLIGWEHRQPAREDGSSERAKRWRENNKSITERNRTQPNATERQDKDTDTDKESISLSGAKNRAEPKTKKKLNGHVRGTRLTPEWKLPSEWGHWALEQGMKRDAILEQEDIFRDYWIARADAKAVKLSWQATWRNWIRKHLKEHVK